MNSVDMIPSFVDSLRRLDRSSVAKLRRAIRKTEWSPDVLSVVAPHLPPDDGFRRDTALKVFGIVAALYGWNSKACGRGSIGRALHATGPDNRPAAERLMRQAMNATRVDSLRTTLTKIMAVLDRAGVPVDWERLTRDLFEWESTARIPQRCWSCDFWGAAVKAKKTKKA